MTLRVQQAILESDRDQLIAILERNILGSHQEKHFAWRHFGNPAGPGWSWVLRNGNGQSIVAMASVFPRKMYVAGKPVLCGQVGEFVVDANYRSLGPAVMLQRATFSPVEWEAIALCYDCPPHDEGMSTFVRLGMTASCEVMRFAFPLRTDEFLAKRLGPGMWTKPVVGAGNLLLKMRALPPNARGLEIRHFDQPFGEEFSRLDEVVSDCRVVRASRSAEELNWRYRAHPEWRFRTLVARRGGELQAFLAFVVFGTRASIVDIFGRDLPIAGLALLEAAIDVCRREKLSCMEGYCTEASGIAPLFRRAGFSLRERAARVVAYSGNKQLSGKILDGVRWALSQVEIML